MRALVTESTGRLGNNLVRTLLDAGHEVWALARSKEKAQQELGDTGVRILLGDIRNVADFAYDLRGIEVIFHTAAYFREYYSPGDHSNAIELTNVREKGFFVAAALPSWMWGPHDMISGRLQAVSLFSTQSHTNCRQ